MLLSTLLFAAEPGMAGLVYVVVFLLFPALLTLLHMLCDLVIQKDFIVKEKEKPNKELLKHVGIYTGTMMLLLSPMFFSWLGLFFFQFVLFGIILFVSHYVIDFISAQLTKRVWNEEKKTKFYLVLVFDQLLHIGLLILTYIWILTI